MRIDTNKFKGMNIGISETYPKLKKPKGEDKRAKILRDKLIIEG